MNKKPIQSALISVFDKTGIDTIAKLLHQNGVVIYSTGGTQDYLEKLGIPVIPVEEATGYPSIFGGRVKTLHPNIFGGILYRRDNREDLTEARSHGIPSIDLVIVDLYPFEDTVSSGASEEDIIEKIDIGGVALIRAAAKNFNDVTVVASKEQYPYLIGILSKGSETSLKQRTYLRNKAFEVTSSYDMAIDKYFSKGSSESIRLEKTIDLKYGENPHQKTAAIYSTDGDDILALSKFELAYGNYPGAVNQTDIWRALTTMRTIGASFDVNDFKVPYMSIAVKHGNSCGVGVTLGEHIDMSTPVDSIFKMLAGDLESVLGAVVVCNFTIDKEVLLSLFQHYTKNNTGWRMLSGIVCADITSEALEILKTRESKTFIMTNHELVNLNKNSMYKGKNIRQLGDDFIIQDSPTFIPRFENDESFSLEGYTEMQEENNHSIPKQDLLLAWAICSTSNSNTITIVRDGMLLANGVGQQSRVRGAKLAISNGEHTFTLHEDILPGFNNSVAWSDSFFPFPDAVEVLSNNGIKVIGTTLGSKNDQKVIDYAKSKRVLLITYPDSVARGFSGH